MKETYQITMTEPEQGRVVLTLRQKDKKKMARVFICSAAAHRILDMIQKEGERGTAFYGEVVQ